jgi:hypothetical protein
LIGFVNQLQLAQQAIDKLPQPRTILTLFAGNVRPVSTKMRSAMTPFAYLVRLASINRQQVHLPAKTAQLVSSSMRPDKCIVKHAPLGNTKALLARTHA